MKLKVAKNIINSQLSKTFAFVENVRMTIPNSYNKKIYHFDINKCRKNCLYYSEFDYPVFTVMDQPEIFNDNITLPGLYYAETEQYFPLRGNGWYSQPMIEYCLSYGMICEDDIKFAVYSGLTIPSNYYVKFIKYLYESLDDKAKLSVNTFIGAFKPKIRESWKSKFITTNHNEAYNEYLKIISNYQVYIMLKLNNIFH